jgi:hypothetical protein
MNMHDDDDLLLSVACEPSTTISALQAAYCEKRRDRIPHVINFVETVVSDYTEEEFRKRFRMNRTTFNALLVLRAYGPEIGACPTPLTVNTPL